MRPWVPLVIVAIGTAFFAYDIFFGCGNPGPGEHCDGTISPFVFLASLVLAVFVWGTISAGQALQRRWRDDS